MLPEKIMQSDFIDILFENKNKSYGAYALRRAYNKTLLYATSLTFFIAGAFSFLQFMHHSQQKDIITSFIIPPDNVLTDIHPVKPLPEKPAVSAANHFKQIINSTPLIVSDDKKTEMPDVDEINNSIISNKKMAGADVDGTIQPPSETREGKGNMPVVEIIKPDDKPLTIAQVMPEYPGGIEALKRFMLRNLKQPDDLQPGEKIIVRACFVVNKDGNIEQVKILNGARDDLNKEVQRVINKMPLWKPGMQNGASVAVYFMLPVTFIGEEE